MRHQKKDHIWLHKRYAPADTEEKNDRALPLPIMYTAESCLFQGHTVKAFSIASAILKGLRAFHDALSYGNRILVHTDDTHFHFYHG